VLTDVQLITAIEEHVNSPLQDWLTTSDLLLIGSRALGFADSSSDYDVVLLTEQDTGHGNVLFQSRPGTPEIGVAVIGPSARANKESVNLAEWVYDITHARLLRRGNGAAVTYQGHLARVWDSRRAEEAAHWRAAADAALQLATSAMRHDQVLAAQLVLGRALHAVMNLVVTTGETGRPNDKWLPRVVAGLTPYGPAALEAAERWCRAGAEPDGVAAALDSLSDVLRGLPPSGRRVGQGTESGTNMGQS
jgi:hypothetical protein